MDEKEELSGKALDAVTGGHEDDEFRHGIYRCTVCNWEWPYPTAPVQHMYPCRKCGGAMMWHEL